jgi:hypothetical protein
LWSAVAVVPLAVLVVAVPGSPAYLPTVLNSPDRYGGQSAGHWVRELESPDRDARLRAVHALGAIGPAAGEAAPALARVLVEDPDPQTRAEAALALSKMVPPARGVAPALGQALADEDPVVRANAALALLKLGPEARPAIDALTRAVRDDRNQTYTVTYTFSAAETAAVALGRATAGTPDAVPALTEVLETASSDWMRRAACRGLGEVGPPARPATPSLRILLGDNDADVRAAAEEALVKIEGRPVRDDERPSTDGPELPEPERAYLWEVEHHGNLLVKHGFGPLADALARDDAAALARLLADDFAGGDLRDPRRVQATTGAAKVERLEDAGHPPTPLDRDAFVARLLEFRKVFTAGPPKVKLALKTLSPKDRGKLDGPWEGTAQLRLAGEHAEGGPAEVVAVLRYEVPRPTAEALAKPGWLRAATVKEVATATAPSYLFAEVGRQRGLDPTELHDNWRDLPLRTTTGGVYVTDFDRDGILDVLVSDVNLATLYRGRPGGVEDVTARCGLPARPPEPTMAGWRDIDGDGWEDLVLAGRVYRNEAGQRFADYSGRCSLRVPADAAGLAVADYDRDGRLDVYVTRSGPRRGASWLEGRTADLRGNYLYRNLGDWRFEDVTRASGALGGYRSTFTAAWLDADDDGWPDLHVPNEFGDGVLLVNQRDGTFREQPLADRPADFGTMGLAVGDVNNDGRIDIYCDNMYSKAGTRVIGNMAPDAYPPDVMEKLRRFVAGSQLHLNRGGLKFEQVGSEMQVAAVGWSYGVSLADLDNDGWLDVYATAGFVSRDRNEPDG